MPKPKAPSPKPPASTSGGRHPAAIARDAWAASEEGVSCSDLFSLYPSIPPRMRVFLINRLDLAFQAGWDAAEKHAPPAPGSFDSLRQVNVRRCEQSFHKLSSWSPCDWATAVAGECGEACNVVKKMKRRADGLQLANTPELPELTRMLAEELADLVIYADLLAARCGIDLGAAVASKFNAVSKRVGSNITLPNSQPPSPNPDAPFDPAFAHYPGAS